MTDRVPPDTVDRKIEDWRREQHREKHFVTRVGWLRAAVLGANDGLLSTSSLMVGVARMPLHCSSAEAQESQHECAEACDGDGGDDERRSDSFVASVRGATSIPAGDARWSVRRTAPTTI